MQTPMDHPRIYEILILQSRSHHLTKQKKSKKCKFKKKKKEITK
jgi:hypothetical protein